MSAGVATTRVIGEVCKVASKPPVWAEVLFRLVRARRPANCVEMGTCMGISASYIASALKLNGQGRLVTLEGAAAFAEVARANLSSLGLENATVHVGRFADTLPPTLRDLQPVEFLFVDGHHDRDATLDYFAQARPHLAGTSTVVFDDIEWSEGMREAWTQIQGAVGGFKLGPFGLCFDVAPDVNTG
jgi:predicted O-methyltransferase YrrM